MDIREKIAYLVYRFGALNDGDRNRVQYLELADDILAIVKAEQILTMATGDDPSQIEQMSDSLG